MQGTEFVNQVNNKLCEMMKTTKRIATAYHPMTNGFDERWNQTLQTAIRKVIDPDNQDDWNEHLDHIMSAYRTTRHESTGMSPYFMVYHNEPRLPVDIEHRTDIGELSEESEPIFHEQDTFKKYAEAMINIKNRMNEIASINITNAQARQKKNFDKRHLIPSFDIGTMVLVKNMTRLARQGGKMDSHYTGPFEIVEEIGKGVYKIRDPETNKVLGKSINSMRFKVYYATTEQEPTDINPNDNDSNEEPNEIDPSTSDQELPDIATIEPIKRKKEKIYTRD